MRRAATVGALAAGGVVAAGVALAVGTLRWKRETARSARELAASVPTADGAERYSPEQLDGLPEPVRRYFEHALTPGQPLVRRARIAWAGEFHARPDGPWSPFTAVQHFAVRPPGFVWDADIRMAPLLPTRVRDGYLHGEGAMLGKVAALVTVVAQRGTPEMAAGALSRYLGEAVWLPTALLPSAGVVWTAIDDRSARATLTDGPTTVSLDVRFGPGGEVVEVSTMRHRDVGGAMVLTPWVARLDRERLRVDGMAIPRGGEAEWVLPEGPLPYWRGRVVGAEYELAP